MVDVSRVDDGDDRGGVRSHRGCHGNILNGSSRERQSVTRMIVVRWRCGFNRGMQCYGVSATVKLS